MEVFQDFISKLDGTGKRERNIGNLYMRRGGSFQKERFLFLVKSSMVFFLTPKTPPVRTPLTGSISNTVLPCFINPPVAYAREGGEGGSRVNGSTPPPPIEDFKRNENLSFWNESSFFIQRLSKLLSCFSVLSNLLIKS